MQWFGRVDFNNAVCGGVVRGSGCYPEDVVVCHYDCTAESGNDSWDVEVEIVEGRLLNGRFDTIAFSSVQWHEKATSAVCCGLLAAENQLPTR